MSETAGFCPLLELENGNSRFFFREGNCELRTAPDINSGCTPTRSVAEDTAMPFLAPQNNHEHFMIDLTIARLIVAKRPCRFQAMGNINSYATFRILDSRDARIFDKICDASSIAYLSTNRIVAHYIIN